MTFIIFAALCLIIGILLLHIRHTNAQLREAAAILEEIHAGNMDRRLLAHDNTAISALLYQINDIILQEKEKLTEIGKSEKAYRKLVTNLSHDIRTPLASLIGYLEVLERHPISQEEHDRFLLIAKAKALHLSDYIQTLFEWLKLESGEWTYHFELVNICEVTRQVMADWILPLEQHQIQFQFDIPDRPVCITTDRKAYERIVNNIVSNIIKHSKASHLRMSVGCSGGSIVISISDNGTGISEADLPHVFDRLYQCDSARSDSGNGLGLAIAKELAAALKGELTVKSRQNNGTAFFLRLPQNMEKA